MARVSFAPVVKLADTIDLGSIASGVQVQVLSGALKKEPFCLSGSLYFFSGAIVMTDLHRYSEYISYTSSRNLSVTA